MYFPEFLYSNQFECKPVWNIKRQTEIVRHVAMPSITAADLYHKTWSTATRIRLHFPNLKTLRMAGEGEAWAYRAMSTEQRSIFGLMEPVMHQLEESDCPSGIRTEQSGDESGMQNPACIDPHSHQKSLHTIISSS